MKQADSVTVGMSADQSVVLALMFKDSPSSPSATMSTSYARQLALQILMIVKDIEEFRQKCGDKKND